MKKAKQTEQREIERIELSDTQDLVVSIVDDQKLDLRALPKGGYGFIFLMITGLSF